MKSFFKKLFILKPSPEHHLARLVAAGICALIVNLTGYFLQNSAINATGTLGLFTFLHFQAYEGHRTMKRLFFVGASLMLAYATGLIISQVPLAAPIFIGLVAFFARLIYRIYRIDKPGDIFVILVMAAGATKDVPLSQFPIEMMEIGFGVVVSLCVALITIKVLKLPKQSYTFTLHVRDSIRMEPRMVVDSFYYATVLFFASYLNIVLDLSPYSWIIVSCSAILQGNTLDIILNRSFQRIFGTIAGLATAAIILIIPIPPLVRIASVVILYMITEYFMPKNYSLGVFFVTNMVLIQMTFQNPNLGFEYLGYRFEGITIGSILGGLAAFLQFHIYRFYSQSVIRDRTYDYKEKMDNEYQSPDQHQHISE